MFLVDRTLPTPAENLALDEALVDWAEASRDDAEVLRLWESPAHLVVTGRSSRSAAEVDLAACQELGIPVLRRSSGGAAIIAGPGCLMYAVILSFQRRPALHMIDATHDFVLTRLVAALAGLGVDVEQAGTSDLVLPATPHLAPRKVSGNSLRIKRTHLLYHGTLLYGFDLSLLGRCLQMPPRQPDYRQARPHDAFVANLPVTGPALREALIDAWHADGALPDLPVGSLSRLVEEKYQQADWNRRS